MDINLTLTPQEASDIRALISIAVWIRSEQLANPDQVLVVDTHDVDIPKAQASRRAGQMWVTRLDTMLKALGGMAIPSWMK